MKGAYIKTAKQMYIAGNSDTAIASALGVTARTVQNWRKKAITAGDDWAATKLAAIMTKENIDRQEKEFLSLLISSFEQTFEAIKQPPKDTTEATVRLRLLKDYAQSYWQLKAPIKKEDQAQKINIIMETIKALADLAIEHEANEVALWLSEYAEKITTRVFKK